MGRGGDHAGEGWPLHRTGNQGGEGLMDDPMLKHRFVDAMDAARLCLQDAYNESAATTQDRPTRASETQALATMALAQATVAVADRLEAIYQERKAVSVAIGAGLQADAVKLYVDQGIKLAG